MGRMKDALMEPSEPVCDECGAPLEDNGDDEGKMVCSAAIPCLRQHEEGE